MRIVIPTLSRIDNQTTFEDLPDDMKKEVIFVVQRHEYDEFSKAWGDQCSHVVKLPEDVKKIGATRQFIWERFKHERFAMLDDDIVVSHRTMHPNQEKMWVCDDGGPDKWRIVFDWANSKMDSKIPVCSCIGSVVPPTPSLFPETRNTRIYMGVMIDGPALTDDWNVNPIYDRGLDAVEDMDVQLQLLSQGVPTILKTDYFFQQRTTGQPGGCEVWRGVEEHNHVMRLLAGHWPEYVRLKEKVGQAVGNMSNQKRLHAVIQWKKCFNAGKQRRSNAIDIDDLFEDSGGFDDSTAGFGGFNGPSG